MQSRLDKALSVTVKPVKQSMETRGSGRILDVGSGTGVLVPELIRQGLAADCIVGVDISAEMTRVASKAYPAATFETGDFLTYHPSEDTLFDCVLFCMALHDLPDPLSSIKHALTLVRSGGFVIVSHPRGASHVLMQHRTNPIMVPNVLPTTADLESLCAEVSGVQLLLPPPSPNDARDKAEGYLCVLEKA